MTGDHARLLFARLKLDSIWQHEPKKMSPKLQRGEGAQTAELGRKQALYPGQAASEASLTVQLTTSHTKWGKDFLLHRVRKKFTSSTTQMCWSTGINALISVGHLRSVRRISTCSQRRSTNQALQDASCLVLVRMHRLVVDHVQVIEQHNYHKTRLNTCDNIKHVWFFRNTKLRKRMP